MGSASRNGTIEIVDVLGRRVGMVSLPRTAVELRRTTFDIASIPAGLYFVIARFGDHSISKRLVKLDLSK